MNGKNFLIGCVADDFTGAGDAASFLAENGVKTILTNGIPEKETVFEGDFDAIVIALKSRTQETASAVRDSLEAFEWLRENGAQTLYFKYCSTFDSTPKGNIGPVIDAVLEKYSTPYTVICPSLLPNGRKVKDGILYVNGIPLAESHMKNHPLTPMTESDIVKLMEPQGKYPCFKITAKDLNESSLEEKISELADKHAHFYLCPDYYEADHGFNIIKHFGKLPFLTGGSGLIGDFAAFFSAGEKKTENISDKSASRLIFAGSCSQATRGQVQTWLENGKKGLMVSPENLRSGIQSEDTVWEFIMQNAGEDMLIYSAGSGGADTSGGVSGDAELLENLFASLAARARDNGYTKIISAGGETSGAVTKALGYRAFYIGQSAAPGVPVMSPVENPKLQIVLKSGNFGNYDFFLTTLV